MRPRLYANNADRQRAYRERKGKATSLSDAFATVTASSFNSALDLVHNFYPWITEEGIKEAYPVYMKLKEKLPKHFHEEDVKALGIKTYEQLNAKIREGKEETEEDALDNSDTWRDATVPFYVVVGYCLGMGEGSTKRVYMVDIVLTDTVFKLSDGHFMKGVSFNTMEGVLELLKGKV